MKQRTITSVAIAAVGLLLVVLSKFIVFPIALSVLSVIAAFEMLRVTGVQKNYAICIPAYLLSAAFPVLAFFVERIGALQLLLAVAAFAFLYLMWLMGVSVFSRGKLSFSSVSEVFTSVIYVAMSFTSLSLMRYMNKGGVFLVVLVFVIAWVCDIAAFAVGSLVGKHKLVPEISPKKTVEGAIGGVVFSAIFCLIYGIGLDLVLENVTVNYVVMLLFGTLLSVVSQLGDLIASLLKREYGVKDYGNLLPGHGGIMDRFDSVLAVSTMLMILSLVFPPFVMN